MDERILAISALAVLVWLLMGQPISFPGKMAVVSDTYFPQVPQLGMLNKQHPYLFFDSTNLAEVKLTYNQALANGWDHPLRNTFGGETSIPMDSPELNEEERASWVKKYAFRYKMEDNQIVAEQAYIGLMNINTGDRGGQTFDPGPILNRERNLVNYIRGYDYVYDYISETHPEDLPFIEDQLMDRAAQLSLILREVKLNRMPMLTGSERSTVPYAVILATFAIPNYNKQDAQVCIEEDRAGYPTPNCQRYETFTINSQELLSHSLQVLFGPEPNTEIQALAPEYFNAQYFQAKGRDGVEAGNDKEYHAQYTTYPTIIAWDNLFGPGNSLLTDFGQILGDARIETSDPNGWPIKHGISHGSPHIGTPIIAAMAAEKLGNDPTKYLVPMRRIIFGEIGINNYDYEGKTQSGNWQMNELMDVFIAKWTPALETAYDNADISNLHKEGTQSTIFLDSGLAVLRDGYDYDANMVIVNAQRKGNDKWGYPSHQGGFQIFAQGSYLVKDMTFANLQDDDYTYAIPHGADPTSVDGCMDKKPFSASQAGTSAILIDGYGVKQVHAEYGNIYDPATITGYDLTELVDYVGVNIIMDEDHITEQSICDGALNGVGEPNGVEVQRDFIFTKDYLIVADENSRASNSHDYSFNLWTSDLGFVSVIDSQNVQISDSGAVLQVSFITPINQINTYPMGNQYLVRSVSTGTNVPFLTVLYPHKSGAVAAQIESLPTQGGYAAKIITPTSTDYILYKTSSTLTVPQYNLETNANLVYITTDHYYIVGGGSTLRSGVVNFAAGNGLHTEPITITEGSEPVIICTEGYSTYDECNLNECVNNMWVNETTTCQECDIWNSGICTDIQDNNETTSDNNETATEDNETTSTPTFTPTNLPDISKEADKPTQTNWFVLGAIAISGFILINSKPKRRRRR